MSDEGFACVRELRHTFENHFEWWCVDGQIDQKQVLAAIGTCALVIAELTGSQGDVYTESDRLGRWADAGNIAEYRTVDSSRPLAPHWIAGRPTVDSCNGSCEQWRSFSIGTISCVGRSDALAPAYDFAGFAPRYFPADFSTRGTSSIVTSVPRGGIRSVHASNKSPSSCLSVLLIARSSIASGKFETQIRSPPSAM